MKGFTVRCHKGATQHQHEHKTHKKQPQLPPEAEAKTKTEEQQAEVKNKTKQQQTKKRLLQSSLLIISLVRCRRLSMAKEAVSHSNLFSAPRTQFKTLTSLSPGLQKSDDRGH